MRYSERFLFLFFSIEIFPFLINLFSHVEHIINETVRLFSLGSIPSESNNGRILPLHFLALLDPEANWFRTWMVCNMPSNFLFLYFVLY